MTEDPAPSAVTGDTQSEPIKIWDILAYYLTPPVWISEGKPETDADIDIARASDVYRTELPHGISASVRSDGLCMFDFSQAGPNLRLIENSTPSEAVALTVMRQRVQVMNAHLACLYTACFRGQEVMRRKSVLSHTDVILFNADRTEMQLGGNSALAALVLTQRPRTYDATMQVVPELNTAPVRRQNHIKKATVIASFDLLRAVLEGHAPNALRFADLLLQGCVAIEESDYDRALVISWAVIENLLTRFYEHHLGRLSVTDGEADDVIAAAKEQSRRAAKGETVNVGTMIRFLSGRKLIPDSLVEELTNVQDVRDGWLHRLEPVAKADASHALMLSLEMLELIDEIKFELPPWEVVLVSEMAIVSFDFANNVSVDEPITLVLPGASRVAHASLQVKMRSRRFRGPAGDL